MAKWPLGVAECGLNSQLQSCGVPRVPPHRPGADHRWFAPTRASQGGEGERSSVTSCLLRLRLMAKWPRRKKGLLLPGRRRLQRRRDEKRREAPAQQPTRLQQLETPKRRGRKSEKKEKKTCEATKTTATKTLTC